MTLHLLSVYWDIDPILFSSGAITIRYYSLAWALAFLFGAIMFYNYTKKDGYGLTAFAWFYFLSFILTILGARLGHCLFYEPGYYLSHPDEIFRMSNGGMASHGAALGLLGALWISCVINKVPYLWSLDRVMLPVSLGGALVRIGNLMNSEIYGIETDAPWGFVFVRMGETAPKHPTQIYEALCYFATFLLLTMMYRRDLGSKRPGLLFGTGLTSIFLSRFIIEFIKNPQSPFEYGMILTMGQWLSIPFILTGLYFIFRSFNTNNI